MARRAKSNEPLSLREPPAKTVAGRENQLINMTIDLVEKQIREGTASSQVLTHFLKLASTREQLEQAKIRCETKMIEAKSNAVQDSGDYTRIANEALEAFKTYSGAATNQTIESSAEYDSE